MRLAWWRDQLAELPSARPQGDPILAGLGDHWAGREDALAALVDGWEELLGEAPLEASALRRFAEARGKAFAAFADLAGAAEAENAADRDGQRWALADLAFRTGDPRERDTAFALARAIPAQQKLPASLRGIAVLGALATHSLAREEPLCTGRVAPLVALRVGMTGR